MSNQVTLFLVILKYIKPLDEVDHLLAEHRAYLNKLLNEGTLLLAGRQNPRTGGVILFKNVSRAELEKILKEDPFVKVSKHEIIEFTPSLYDDCLKEIVSL